MKNKQKEQEKSIKDKDYADRKSQEMHNEVEKASAQLTALKKKAKEDAEKFAELESRKSKELASLNKQFEDAGRKIRHLENLNETLRKKLDRKTEENTSISKKLKDSAATASGLKSNRTSVNELAFL